jgi:hypothetical protein
VDKGLGKGAIKAIAPHDEEIGMGLSIPFVEILVVMVKADVLLASVPVHKDKGTEEGGILGEDGIAEEGVKKSSIGGKQYLDHL